MVHDSGTQRLPRLVGLTQALEMILVHYLKHEKLICFVLVWFFFSKPSNYLLLSGAFLQLSKPIRGQEAYTAGLVDEIATPEKIVARARQWALDIADYRRPKVLSLYKNDKLEPLGEAREVLKFARAQTQKRAPNLRHPLVCIDVIEEGIVSGPVAGLWKV